MDGVILKREVLIDFCPWSTVYEKKEFHSYFVNGASATKMDEDFSLRNHTTYVIYIFLAITFRTPRICAYENSVYITFIQ